MILSARINFILPPSEEKQEKKSCRKRRKNERGKKEKKMKMNMGWKRTIVNKMK